MSSNIDNRGSRIEIKAYQDLKLERGLECVTEETNEPISFAGKTVILQIFLDVNMRSKELQKTLTVNTNIIALSVTEAEMKTLTLGNYYFRIILESATGLEPFLFGSFNVVAS
jgi:hypothetical protein